MYVLLIEESKLRELIFYYWCVLDLFIVMVFWCNGLLNRDGDFKLNCSLDKEKVRLWVLCCEVYENFGESCIIIIIFISIIWVF